MNLLRALNPEQREAAEHQRGPLLILAGAGSGKTRVITTRIAHLIRARGVAPERILAVTFTNKAAREMRQRVSAISGEAAKEVTISTFHAFGARLLRAHASAIGRSANFSIYDRDDQISVMRTVLGELGEINTDPLIMLARLSQCKSRALSPAEVEEGELLPDAYRGYQRILANRNALDLDDLLLEPLRLIEGEGELAKELLGRFEYVMVDEYQDTNHVQYRMVKALVAGSRNLCVVGDDDQAIYGWRGADVRNILAFKEDWPDAKVIKLVRNYRSTPNILAAANAVIALNPNRTDKRLVPHLAGGERLDFTVGRDARDEAEKVVARLVRRRDRSDTTYGQMAILYRANHLSRTLEEALRARTVPYRIVGGHGFYDRREVKDLLAYLRWLENPEDRLSFERVVAFPRKGIGPTAVAAVEAAASARGSLEAALEAVGMVSGLTANARNRLADLHRRMRALRAEIRGGGGLARGVRALVDGFGLESALRATAKTPEEAENRIENQGELLRAVREYENRASDPSLRGFLDRVSLITETDKGEDGLKDAVILMTLHSAKGLEFPHVVIVGFEDGMLPSQRALEEGPQGEEEERRLAYVGITRARESLLLSAAIMRSRQGRILETKLSRFLDDIPSELFELAPRAIEARSRRAAAVPSAVSKGQGTHPRRRKALARGARLVTPERRRSRR